MFARCFIMPHTTCARSFHPLMLGNVCNNISPRVPHHHRRRRRRRRNSKKFLLDCEKLCRMLCGKWHEIWVWLKLNKHGKALPLLFSSQPKHGGAQSYELTERCFVVFFPPRHISGGNINPAYSYLVNILRFALDKTSFFATTIFESCGREL